MTPAPKRNKYRILLVGYALLWGAYFGFRTYQVLTMEIVDGQIMGRIRKPFRIYSPRGKYGGTHGDYICAALHFKYKISPTDTGTWYDAFPQALSFNEYPDEQKTRIIFPKGKPELATIYSLEEFWFPAPYMITLLAITTVWSIGFIVVVFKPWREMSE